MSRFITLEGGEGAGKSSLLRQLYEKLNDSGIDVVATREPGGTAVAERIRALLLGDTGEETMDTNAELLLMFAARAQHLHSLVRPALQAGRWVLCDRFTDATRAYQGYGRGRSLEWIEQLAEQVHDGTEPCLTLLLDINPELGLARALKGRAPDRMESASLAFHQRVRDGYLALARRWPERFVVLNADAPQADVFDQAWDKVKPLLETTPS